jgi:hypothetical protein
MLPRTALTAPARTPAILLRSRPSPHDGRYRVPSCPLVLLGLAGRINRRSYPLVSFPWLIGPIGYVDDNGEVLTSEEGELVVGGPDLLPPPDALKAGQRVLVFLGIGSYALPGAPAYTTAPVMTAVFAIDGEEVILGDGSSVSLSAAASAIETVYAKQRSDYAETPANMASGADASP